MTNDASRLREIADDLSCYSRPHFRDDAEELRQIADRMETESKVAETKWIDVIDRLPEPGEQVLVWAGGLAIGFVRICDIPKGKPDWVIVNYPHHRHGEYVSHWKPSESPWSQKHEQAPKETRLVTL